MAPSVAGYGASGRVIAPLTARDRVEAGVLTVLVHAALLALLLLIKGAPPERAPPVQRLTVFDPPPEAKPPPPPPRPDPRPEAAPRGPPAPVPLPEPAAPAAIEPLILIPRPVEAAPGEASSGHGAVGDGESGRGGGGGGGAGGNGQGGTGGDGLAPDTVLRTGKWWRQPTALDFNPPPNLRAGAPKSGWGEIVCRSARNYRLVECEVRDEFPANSGFSEAMRAASRRFRYLVTDEAGKPVIGQRVLVHLNFLEPKAR